MTLRLGHLSDDLRYDAWSRIAERIYEEQRDQAWSHYIFRRIRAMFMTNPELSDNGGFIFQWMAGNYVDAALMLLRRELDKQAGTQNLRNLLCDMINHPNVVTRGRYLSRWGKQEPFDRCLANRAFDSFNPTRVTGDANADHIDPCRITEDLDRVCASAERLRDYAEKTRAHRSPEQKVDTSGMTFLEMHKAIADIREVVAKYYALLTLKLIAQWEPEPQFDTLKPFTRPWVVDRAAVEQAAKE